MTVGPGANAPRVTIRVPRDGLRRWHQELAERLTTLMGAEVAVDLAPAEPVSRASACLLGLERLLHRLPEVGMARVGEVPSGMRRPARTGHDLVIDLSAAPLPESWSVRYDGRAGEAAAIAAVMGGRSPVVEVWGPPGSVLASGRPGSDRPGLLATALPDLFAGVETLLLGSLFHSPFARPLPDRAGVPDQPAGVLRLATSRVLGAGSHRAYRALFRAPHWRVGWRWADVPGSPRRLPSGWQGLPDDGWHFYADPFLFHHAGRTHLFVEDFDHRLGKAVISVVEMGLDGPLGRPEPVLQHDVHMSYPFVLEHHGEIWMIPETSGARTVELYRAVDYPHTWARDSVLLEDIVASDATPFRHDGRWWLSATVRDGGSCSDTLHLWTADDLRGPWQPHRANPVLVDAAGARPAGRVIEEDGRLVRPVQDCRDGYGGAMNLAEIVRLDDDAFEQRPVGRIAPGQSWPGSRLHTWNTAGGLEVIDGSRLVPRSVAAYRRLTPRLERAGDERHAFLVAREDDLDLRGVEYASLYSVSEATAFQHGAWLERVYGDLAPRLGARRCIVTIRSAADGRLVGVLPLVRRRRLGLRVVEYADLGVSDYARPVLDRSWRAAMLEDRSIARRVRRLLGGFDLIRIDRVPDDPEPLATLLGARKRRHHFDTHMVKLAGSHETWREGLDASFARHLDRKYKRLRPKGGVELRQVTDPDEVPLVMELLRRFRTMRFDERGGTDLVQAPEHFAFYSSVARDAVAGTGPARLVVLDVGGTPAAVALDLAESDRELFLLVGYDLQRLRNYSLGLLIVDRLANDAIERGLAHLDLTVGDEGYKADFGAVARPLHQLHRARTPLGAVADISGLLHTRARQHAKRLLRARRDRKTGRPPTSGKQGE